MIRIKQTTIAIEIALKAKERMLAILERNQYNRIQIDTLKTEIMQFSVILQEAKGDDE